METTHNPEENLWELGLLIVLRSEHNMWEGDSSIWLHHRSYFQLLTGKASPGSDKDFQPGLGLPVTQRCATFSLPETCIPNGTRHGPGKKPFGEVWELGRFNFPPAAHRKQTQKYLSWLLLWKVCWNSLSFLRLQLFVVVLLRIVCLRPWQGDCGPGRV